MYFNEFWMTNLRKYEHIIYENSDFMSHDWEKINQKFIWLKVASIDISCSTVHDCALFLLVPFLFDIERN
jgi:predicted nucleotidyltransferase